MTEVHQLARQTRCALRGSGASCYKCFTKPLMPKMSLTAW